MKNFAISNIFCKMYNDNLLNHLLQLRELCFDCHPWVTKHFKSKHFNSDVHCEFTTCSLETNVSTQYCILKW